ncbi:unnamed protein product [Spirodela intermedia]|uniref:BZIP domain-containing protein n=1 Tax=Spirodela intermedia TaxID=51605 RepID=A0A7I8KZE6_SPIIN|nr:unnamed protein product [Spirodela intermedia]
MASPCGSGASSGYTLPTTNSGSDEDLQQALNQRKKKRMLSNRESARRSRLRKQRHLDDLAAQVAQLRKENNQILTSYNVITQQILAIDSENSVLRTQTMELSHRLQSLNEILLHMNGLAAVDHPSQNLDGFFVNPWSSISLNHPIMASPDMFQ